MTDEIEFLKNEVARLRTEQVIEDDPIKRLSLEKKIAEARAIIEKFDTNEPTVRDEPRSFQPEKDQNNSSRGAPQKTKAKPAASAGQTKSTVTNRMSLIKIAEGVIAGVLVLVVAWVIAHYFGVTL
ncbi:hypothetical protein [Marinobacter nauticus]|uniref:hypothetical protein n=1 Tax=Marinobacter nauticus TaxID=2743 RepID=UPI001CFE9A42|nr:hypothetical protein [Marinobacter nauticus]